MQYIQEKEKALEVQVEGSNEIMKKFCIPNTMNISINRSNLLKM